MRLGAIELTPIVESRFRLDGGAMFGVVPKPLWERHFPADAQNRIQLVSRVLLLEHEDFVALVDTGMGDSWDDQARAIYAIEPQGVEAALAARRLGTDAVTDVVLTHLHFDHAGGLTVRTKDGVRPRFGRARVHVQAANWRWAASPSPKDAGSFRRGDYEAIEQRLRLVDGDGEVLDGVDVRRSDGHTPGLQIVYVHGGESRSVVFPADLVPTSAHVHLPWVMAYDNEPVRSIEEKRRLLQEAVDHGHSIVFEHDPQVAAARVKKQGNRFVLDPVDLA